MKCHWCQSQKSRRCRRRCSASSAIIRFRSLPIPLLCSASNPVEPKMTRISAVLRTSSLMMSDGRRPLPSSGGIREPRRLDGPLPGARDALRSGSRITSIFGASMVGALISGTFGPSWYKTDKLFAYVNEFRHVDRCPVLGPRVFVKARFFNCMH